jgi:hypothetical protein
LHVAEQLARRVAPCAADVRDVSVASPSGVGPGAEKPKGIEMMLATTTVEDFDRFLNIFSTKGAEKRKEHGSKGATVYRDPNEDDRVWVLFDWDEQGFQNFLSDPEVPPIIQEAGHKSRPQPAEFGGQYDA